MAKSKQSEWFKGRDSHSGARLRNITLELEGESKFREFQAWRVWERDDKTGFQLTNRQIEGTPEKWQWFNNSRIVSLSVDPVPEAGGQESGTAGENKSK